MLSFTSLDLNFSLSGGSFATFRGAGGAIAGTAGTIDILDSTSGLTFTAKTASEAVTQYSGFMLINGEAVNFGSDALVIEEGDNAYIIENGGSGLDNVTIMAVATAVPEPSSTSLIGLAGVALLLRRRR